MKGIDKYILFVSVVLLAGCSQITEQEDDKKAPGEEIRLEATTVFETDIDTRAVADFPNNGSIGILTSRTYDPADPAAADWTGYADINNAEATATAENNGTYSFTWVNQKYWPFDGSNLYFMAYSPVAKGNPVSYLLSSDHSSIVMALDPNLPDVMYATGNINPQAYNKTSGTVQLGEFRHLLSKLTVRVVADANMSPNIVLNQLTVSTHLRTASFQLNSADETLTVTPAEEEYVAELASGNLDFKTQPFSNTLFLFPETQDDVKVSITLVDTSNGIPYTFDFMVSFFLSDTNEAVTLVRAKNTILTINVLTIGVQNPERNIQLQGAITDWNDMGDFGVIIN